MIKLFKIAVLGLFLSAGASYGVTFLQATVATGSIPVVESGYDTQTNSSVTYLTMNKPTCSTNDLFLLLGSSNNQGSAFDTPTGFTVIESGTALGHSVAGFYKIVTGSESGTISFGNASANAKIGWYICISGAHDTSPIDVQHAMESAVGTAHTISEVTTTENDVLALAFLGYDSGDGYSYSITGTGWSITSQQQSGTGTGNTSGFFAEKDMASSGVTTDISVTANVSDGGQYFQFAIAPE